MSYQPTRRAKAGFQSAQLRTQLYCHQGLSYKAARTMICNENLAGTVTIKQEKTIKSKKSRECWEDFFPARRENSVDWPRLTLVWFLDDDARLGRLTSKWRCHVNKTWFLGDVNIACSRRQSEADYWFSPSAETRSRLFAEITRPTSVPNELSLPRKAATKK